MISTATKINYRVLAQSKSLVEVAEEIFSKTEHPWVPQIRYRPSDLTYFTKDCRCLYPYFNIMQFKCSSFWIGRPVNEVYFKDACKPPKHIWNDLIEKGLIRVNKKKVSPDYIMKEGDILSHIRHFHELPTLALPAKVLDEYEDLLIVNKPPSVPVHRTGSYRMNTLMSTIRCKWKTALNFNRIDAVTSGIMILGLSTKKVIELSSQLANNQIEKEYICEVRGNFPHDEIDVDVPLTRCFRIHGPMIVDRTSGYPSKTKFKKLSFNGKTSLLSCFPITGRTHQIRVHLQYLGYPIVHDFLYDSRAFGRKLGKNGDYDGLSDREIFTLSRQVTAERVQLFQEESVDVVDEYEELLKDYGSSGWIDYMHKKQFDPEKNHECQDCYICQENCFKISRDFAFLHLHALRHKGPNWEFSVPLPHWARNHDSHGDSSS